MGRADGQCLCMPVSSPRGRRLPADGLFELCHSGQPLCDPQGSDGDGDAWLAEPRVKRQRLMGGPAPELDAPWPQLSRTKSMQSAPQWTFAGELKRAVSSEHDEVTLLPKRRRLIEESKAEHDAAVMSAWGIGKAESSVLVAGGDAGSEGLAGLHQAVGDESSARYLPTLTICRDDLSPRTCKKPTKVEVSDESDCSDAEITTCTAVVPYRSVHEILSKPKRRSAVLPYSGLGNSDFGDLHYVENGSARSSASCITLNTGETLYLDDCPSARLDTFCTPCTVAGPNSPLNLSLIQTSQPSSRRAQLMVLDLPMQVESVVEDSSLRVDEEKEPWSFGEFCSLIFCKSPTKALALTDAVATCVDSNIDLTTAVPMELSD